MLSDREVIDIVKRHIESKFPKDCSRCGRCYGPADRRDLVCQLSLWLDSRE